MNSAVSPSWLDVVVFSFYPYICLTVFFLGSWLRFDRDQYSWKSDSSQLLRKGMLRSGSYLFHVGVLVIFVGHLFGLLTPHFVYDWLITPGQKQLLAMTVGGIAGVIALVGAVILLIRRLGDVRIRVNSRMSDFVLLWVFLLQLLLGLATVFLSAQHLDGAVMLQLSDWAQRVVTLRGGTAELMAGQSWIFKAHMFLGMTIFVIFPFTRLVHVWSGFASVSYLFRPYQVVRSRRLARRWQK